MIESRKYTITIEVKAAHPLYEDQMRDWSSRIADELTANAQIDGVPITCSVTSVKPTPEPLR